MLNLFNRNDIHNVVFSLPVDRPIRTFLSVAVGILCLTFGTCKTVNRNNTGEPVGILVNQFLFNTFKILIV